MAVRSYRQTVRLSSADHKDITMNRNWTEKDIPTQTGRTIVVTGTGGLGFEDALALARVGADVIIAGRNPNKGAEAVERIRRSIPAAKITFEPVNLANLASIDAFARRLNASREKIDVLINNAGVMVPPRRETTEDGFELQFGTNYLGHFALTGRLLGLLRRAAAPRVVSLSSVAARNGAINFDDLQAESGYKPMPVYSQSKLACLMFAYELQRRSEAGNWGISSIAAHPGISRTDLLHNAPGRNSLQGRARSYLWFLFQPAARGALPTLYAATSPDARPGGYYGPNKLGETRGFPTDAKPPKSSLDLQTAKRLWDVSEKLAGIRFGDENTIPTSANGNRPLSGEG
jgi:NAD(P)-dependent dehydrogenase (short-subunit alcohol dehydrogenase family)